mmetsp:Transcript_26611/g.61653  ORF Transcript_26611/g.61653 Transcript_26611/m.61653 type:complete len:103 (-) Transcript_26611:16-324(-)
MCSMCAAFARFSGGKQSHSVSSRSNVTAITLPEAVIEVDIEAEDVEASRMCAVERGRQLDSSRWLRGEGKRSGRKGMRAGVGRNRIYSREEPNVPLTLLSVL